MEAVRLTGPLHSHLLRPKQPDFTSLNLSGIHNKKNIHPFKPFIAATVSKPAAKISSKSSSFSSSSSSSSSAAASASSFAGPLMKKAKSQAVACSLDPNKNGLHTQDFNSPDNDVVFDPSSMAIDEDLKPDDPSSALHSGRAVAANLSRKKATPPQPAKKLVIKLVKGLIPDHTLSCLGFWFRYWVSGNEYQLKYTKGLTKIFSFILFFWGFAEFGRFCVGRFEFL